MSKKSVAPIKTLARYEPDTVYIGTGEYVAECVRADDGDYYMVADVDAAIEALQAEIERLSEALRELEEREQRDEALLRQALERLEAVVEHFDPYMGDNECRPMENASVIVTILRERLREDVQ